MANGYFDARGLFGETPEALQRRLFDESQARRDKEMQFLASNTMTPGFTYSMLQSFEPVRKQFEQQGEDPRVEQLKKQVQAAQGAFQGLDMSSTEGMIQAASKLMQMGMIPEATKLLTLAKARREATAGKKSHPYITAGKNIFNTETGEFMELPAEVGNRKVKWIDTTDNQGNPVKAAIDESTLERVMELPAQPSDERSATIDKEIIKSTDEAAMHRVKYDRIQTVLTELQDLPDFGGGLAMTASEAFKDNLGLRNKLSRVKTMVEGIKVDDALARLPPGAASDKDVSLVLGTVPPSNASKAELSAYLNAVKNVTDALATYYEERADWVDKKNTLGGFDAHYRKKYATPRTPEPVLNQNMTAPVPTTVPFDPAVMGGN